MFILHGGCQFNGGRMVMLQKMVTLMKGDMVMLQWSPVNGGRIVYVYGGGQFKGGRMVMLQKWSL